MSSETLLTVVGLLLAVYSILPAERRLDLRLRLRRFDRFLACAALVALHYISYFPVLDSLEIAPSLGPWRWGFTPDSASYLILVGTGAIIWFRASRATLAAEQLPVLAKLVDQLAASGRTADLVYLLERHVDRLEVMERTLREDSNSTPATLEAQDLLRQILKRVLTSRSIVSEVAAFHPRLAVRLAGLEVWDRWEFLDLLVRSLLERRHTPLYYELEHNQNLRAGHRYDIPATNTYLMFFLGDAQRAHDMRIYKPFGDETLAELTRLRRDPAGTRYNAALGDYRESERWECPVHACVRAFDIMLLEAMHQGVESHMWLYYFPLFAERILDNMEPTPDVELWREWPTPYHYLLYEILDALCNWLEEAASIREVLANLAVGTVDLQHENGSIAKSAALALGQVLRSSLCSERLSQGFKTYLVEIALRSALRLDGRADLANVVRLSIAKGGPGAHATPDEYSNRLVEVLRDIDWLLRDKFKGDPSLGAAVASASV